MAPEAARARGVDARVRIVYREWWSRTLVLTGGIEGVVRYEGMGYGERVYLDGALRSRSPNWTWTMNVVTPRLTFTLPGSGGELPALIEVAASFLPWRFAIYRFRLSVNDTVLYDEDTADVWFGGGPGVVMEEPYEPDT